VDKYIGDGVMAVFGHVTPGPDDVDKALACALELVAALTDWKQSSDAKGLPALRAGIGLHVGTVMGGILDAGGHSEFTVVGDAVNVAQRLQTVSKTFEASLVVSADVFKRLSSTPPDVPWKYAADVEIPGRSLCLDVAYLPQAIDHQRIMAAG
jgi:adenylate cyclase